MPDIEEIEKLIEENLRMEDSFLDLSHYELAGHEDV